MLLNFSNRKGVPASLEEVLKYEHFELLLKFSTKQGVSLEEAERIFDETKKMLWLMAMLRCEKSRKVTELPEAIVLPAPLFAMDQMWHEFILFTREYSEFCERFLGDYIHHSPTTQQEKKDLLENSVEAQKFEKEMRLQCLYILKHLGKDTLAEWFKVLPVRFEDCQTLRLRNPS